MEDRYVLGTPYSPWAINYPNIRSLYYAAVCSIAFFEARPLYKRPAPPLAIGRLVKP